MVTADSSVVVAYVLSKRYQHVFEVTNIFGVISLVPRTVSSDSVSQWVMQNMTQVPKFDHYKKAHLKSTLPNLSLQMSMCVSR